LKDQLGIEIEPGVTLCYAQRKGSKLWLRSMRVLKVNGGQIIGLLAPTGRQVTLQRQNSDGLVVARGATL
jgi:hypothetical protein